jgi:hypothetical protein
MRKAIITTIFAGLAAATSVQLSYAASTPGIGVNSAGTIINSAGTIGSSSGLSNEAGSIAAGANSALNPSGNSFIVPPSGAVAGSVFVRPQR